MAAIQIIQETGADYLEIIAVPLEFMNASKFEMPVWQSAGAYRNREPRESIHGFTVEIINFPMIVQDGWDKLTPN